MEDTVQILLVFFDSGRLPTGGRESLGWVWEQREEERRKEMQVGKAGYEEGGKIAGSASQRGKWKAGRAGKGSPNLPKALRWPKAC